MDINGKLVHILPAQTGTSKNGVWKKCDFVIETSDKFPKKVCISAWNELSDQIEKTSLNSELKVSFDISSREYNGKWYTDVKAWKIGVESAGLESVPEGNVVEGNESTPPDFPSIESADDLPF